MKVTKMTKRFVEIGAADFNTCLPLAQSGWHGISVEPVPYLFDRVKKQYEGHTVEVLSERKSALIPLTQTTSIKLLLLTV